MKILYFSTYFPYKNRQFDKIYLTRGAEVVAYNLAVAMGQKGHKISVFTTSATSKFETEQYNGINIYRFRANFNVASGRFSFGLLQNSINDTGDLIHVHNSVPVGNIAGLRYAKKKKLPLIVTYHGDIAYNVSGFFCKMCVYGYNNYYIDKLLSFADLIISPSEFYIKESKVLGKYGDKIIVIPNGVNLEDFIISYSKEECRKRLGLSPGEKIILYLGTLSSRKGIHILLKALPIILKSVPDARLVFIGSGTFREDLKKVPFKLGIEKKITLISYEDELKPLYYKAADVFCLPSMKEVFPIVLLEASASGIPMVVSDLDTFKCLIEEEYNGLFTKRGNEKNLAEAIIYLLENEEIREKMGKNARKKVENYSWEKISEEIQKVYKGIIM